MPVMLYGGFFNMHSVYDAVVRSLSFIANIAIVSYKRHLSKDANLNLTVTVLFSLAILVFFECIFFVNLRSMTKLFLEKQVIRHQ